MKLREKKQAIELRKRGYSLGEICETVNASKSSVSLWVRGLKLSSRAKRLIESKLTKGQKMSIMAHHALIREKENKAKSFALESLSSIKIDKNLAQLICSLLYICEGSRGTRSVMSFTNSDPVIISLFLKMLRKGFVLDENKFRACVHLHTYHDKDKQLSFWSKTTRIPIGRFMKPYQKRHTGVHRKDGYQGCVRVNYYDISLRRKILAIASQFAENTGL